MNSFLFWSEGFLICGNHDFQCFFLLLCAALYSRGWKENCFLVYSGISSIFTGSLYYWFHFFVPELKMAGWLEVEKIKKSHKVQHRNCISISLRFIYLFFEMETKCVLSFHNIPMTKKSLGTVFQAACISSCELSVFLTNYLICESESWKKYNNAQMAALEFFSYWINFNRMEWIGLMALLCGRVWD